MNGGMSFLSRSTFSLLSVHELLLPFITMAVWSPTRWSIVYLLIPVQDRHLYKWNMFITWVSWYNVQTVLIGLGCHSAQDPSANLLHLAEILNGYNSSPVLLFITWQHMPNNSAELLITYQLIRF